MPGSPDFAAVARRILIESDGKQMEAAIANQLRLMWNARGAADIGAIEKAYHPEFGNGAPSTKTLDTDVRRLDR